jgi:hypothetical protein
MLTEKRPPTCCWCPTWLASLASDVERTGFSTDTTAVWFMCRNSKSRLRLLLWPFVVLTVPNSSWHTSRWRCFWLSVSSRGANFGEIAACSSSSRIRWFVSERPDQLAMSEMILRRSALTNSQTFVAFSSSHCIVTESCCWHFMHFRCTKFEANSLFLQISH